MKKILLIVGLLLFFTHQDIFAQAVISFEKNTHDFGTFTEAKSQEAIFKFKNEGTEPLVIHQVLTTCGCTIAEFTKTPIEPGKEGEVKVTYNGKGKIFGKFKKGISVRANTKPYITRLYIMGDMIKDDSKKINN